VTANWELLHFGRKEADRNLSALRIQKSFRDYESYLLSIKTDVTKRYLNAVYQQAYLEWTRKNTQRLLDILEIAKSLSLSGMRPVADTLMAASSYMQVLAENDRRSGELEASRRYLAEYTGEVAAISSDTRAFTNAGSITFSDDSTNAHPLIQAAALRQEELDQEALRAEKQKLPTLALLGGLSTRTAGIYENGTASGNFLKGFDNRANNYLIGAGLTWSFTDLYRSAIKTRSFKMQSLSAQAETEEKKASLHATKTALEQRLTYAQEQLKKSTQSVNQAAAAFEMYVTRYESGLMNLSELLQVQTLLEEAEKKHLENSAAFWMQAADYAGVTGDFTLLFKRF